MKKMLLITVFTMLSLINAEWISTGKGTGEKPIWQETGRGSTTLSYTVQVPGFNSESKNGSFKLLTIPETNCLFKEGYPKIPAVRQLLAIPECDSARVEVIPLSCSYLTNTTIYPNGKMVGSNGMLIEEFDNGYLAHYDSLNGYYPAKNYHESYPAVRGQRLAEIELYPVQYNHDSSRVRLVAEFSLNITIYNSRGNYSANTGIFDGVLNGSLEVNVAQLTVNLTGVYEFGISGKADKANIKSSGVGTLDHSLLVANKMEAKVNSISKKDFNSLVAIL